MSPKLPPPAAIELGDEGKQPAGGGVDVGRQRYHLLFDLFQGVGIGEGIRAAPVLRRRLSDLGLDGVPWLDWNL